MRSLPRYAMALLAIPLVLGCSTKRVHEEPILRNGDRVRVDAGDSDREAERERVAIAARRDSLAASALADCRETDTCDALARREIALGMTETQVLAATRTTERAWRRRDARPATVLTPRSLTSVPRDAIGSVALVQLREGRVVSYGYQEGQGLRTVSRPEDATFRGRAAARAEMLLRQGDDFAARGRLSQALDRYDRADVLLPGDPMVDYRIATVLDKQLRPIQALIQYRLFLHQLELERIEAVGKAYGELAEAIARARERIVVLERRSP